MTSYKEIAEKVEFLEEFVRQAEETYLGDLTYAVDTSEVSIRSFTYDDGEISDIVYDTDDVTVTFNEEDESVAVNIDEWSEIKASVSQLAKMVEEVSVPNIDETHVLVEKDLFDRLTELYDKQAHNGTHQLVENELFYRMANALTLLEAIGQFLNKKEGNNES